MRIGIVTGEYPPMQGGVGAFSQIISRKFVEQGHDAFVYSSTQAQSDDSRIPMTRHQGAWGFNSLSAIKHWAEQNRLDVINIQFQTAAFGMSPFIHFLPNYVRNIPVVTTFHDLRFPYLFPKAGKLRDWIVMHLARASAGTIVTNHEDYERVKHLPKATMIPIGSNILTELPSGFDRNAWRAKAGAKPDDFLIAFFGFMNRSKGVDELIGTLIRTVSKAVPARLVMIGGRTGTSDPTNEEYARSIDLLIEGSGLNGHVIWTGFVTDVEVSAYLAASDVVALPFLDGASFRRGTLMAAIHHGCAIVTTPPAIPIPEFVDNENMHFGTLEVSYPRIPYPPHFDYAVLDLYKSPELREKLKTGARHLSLKFDWNNIARDTITFFERVIHA